MHQREREREARAVWSSLCNKPLKYQMGGRAKQPTAQYERERKKIERKRERERKAGNNVCLDLLLNCYLSDSFILNFSDLLLSPCKT